MRLWKNLFKNDDASWNEALEHEYKLMGMAPYADVKLERAVIKLRTLLRLSEDGLSFEQASDLSMNYCYEYLLKESSEI